MRSKNASRRVVLEALLGLGAGSSLYGYLDSTAWRAYEAVEEAWIRDRHAVLLQQAPAASSAAHVDLELRLADLARRGMQFRHLLKRDPNALRGGVWQLTSLPISERENAEMISIPEYRKKDERVRQLNGALRRHPQYENLRRAQTRLWKTPEYREIHRRYTGRMQELQRLYGTPALPPDLSAGH